MAENPLFWTFLIRKSDEFPCISICYIYIERENNVIMFNLDEDLTTENENDNKDKDFVENLCKNILEIPNIKVQKMFRLGRKSETKIRPLQMVFENNSDKRVFLATCINLKILNQI